jgi:hypothetical protein
MGVRGEEVPPQGFFEDHSRTAAKPWQKRRDFPAEA